MNIAVKAEICFRTQVLVIRNIFQRDLNFFSLKTHADDFKRDNRIFLGQNFILDEKAAENVIWDQLNAFTTF